jgi:ABC-2 type transport system ATP-binding protein
MSDPPAVAIGGVSKRFTLRERPPGPRRGWRRRTKRVITALADVDVQLERGECVGLLGKNGAGKTTLIKVMTGLLLPDAGTARVLGRDPHREQVETAAHIGVTFGQRTQLWWELPARSSFEILRAIYDLPGPAYAARLRELDAALELTSFWDAPVRLLSLGQRVRCDLAAAILHRPAVVFLDEATAGLDLLAKDQVRALLGQLARSGDHLVVLTSHDVADIEALSRRLVVIDGGRLIFDGATAALARLDGRRTVTVRFTQPVADPRVRGARRTGTAGLTATFAPLPGIGEEQVVAELLAAYPVQSITFDGAGVEGVIRGLYDGGGAPGAGAAGTLAAARGAR